MWKQTAAEFQARLEVRRDKGPLELFKDNMTQISYAWMLAMPLRTSPAMKISDKEVSVGLISRTLNPGVAQCNKCHLRTFPSHDLTCSVNKAYRTARHEGLKRLFTTIYKSLDCQVISEPRVERGTSRDRGDLSVRGPAALDGYSVIDFAVVSPVSTTNHPVARMLEDKFKQKMNKYHNQFHGSEFVPFVLTVGGTLHDKAKQVLAKIVERGYGSLELKMEISVELLRSRTEHWYH
jgi:hypothetical protein